MTVTELRDALNALIEQGHGELRVVHESEVIPAESWIVEVAGAELETGVGKDLVETVVLLKTDDA